MPRVHPPAQPSATERAGLTNRETRIPPHAPGMRIGLFGGTFDPPHDAHLGACLLAMRRLNLDRVWWLVTPGNPLKDTRHLAPLAERIAAARKLARHPRIEVSGLEAEIGSHYTYDTIKYLTAQCPGVRFVWIMGADNLRSFHRWNHWRRIAALVPIIVIDRLGPSLYAAAGVAGQALNRFRLPEHKAARLADYRPPAWIFLHGLKSPLSSTALRAIRQSHYDHTSAREITREVVQASAPDTGGKGRAGSADGHSTAASAAPRSETSQGERKRGRGVRDG